MDRKGREGGGEGGREGEEIARARERSTGGEGAKKDVARGLRQLLVAQPCASKCLIDTVTQ